MLLDRVGCLWTCRSRRAEGERGVAGRIPPKRKTSSNLKIHLPAHLSLSKPCSYQVSSTVPYRLERRVGEGRAAVSLGQPSRGALAEAAAGGQCWIAASWQHSSAQPAPSGSWAALVSSGSSGCKKVAATLSNFLPRQTVCLGGYVPGFMLSQGFSP